MQLGKVKTISISGNCSQQNKMNCCTGDVGQHPQTFFANVLMLGSKQSTKRRKQRFLLTSRSGRLIQPATDDIAEAP